MRFSLAWACTTFAFAFEDSKLEKYSYFVLGKFLSHSDKTNQGIPMLEDNQQMKEGPRLKISVVVKKLFLLPWLDQGSPPRSSLPSVSPVSYTHLTLPTKA